MRTYVRDKVKREFVYVCSPLKGKVQENIQNAIIYSRKVYNSGHIPITPHAYLTLFLDGNIPAEREAGMEMGMELLKVCSRIWVFGKYISDGMKREIEYARKHGIKIDYFLD